MTNGEFESTMLVLVQRAMMRQEITKGGPKYFLSFFVEEYLRWVNEEKSRPLPGTFRSKE